GFARHTGAGGTAREGAGPKGVTPGAPPPGSAHPPAEAAGPSRAHARLSSLADLARVVALPGTLERSALTASLAAALAPRPARAGSRSAAPELAGASAASLARPLLASALAAEPAGTGSRAASPGLPGGCASAGLATIGVARGGVGRIAFVELLLGRLVAVLRSLAVLGIVLPLLAAARSARRADLVAVLDGVHIIRETVVLVDVDV